MAEDIIEPSPTAASPVLLQALDAIRRELEAIRDRQVQHGTEIARLHLDVLDVRSDQIANDSKLFAQHREVLDALRGLNEALLRIGSDNKSD